MTAHVLRQHSGIVDQRVWADDNVRLLANLWELLNRPCAVQSVHYLDEIISVCGRTVLVTEDHFAASSSGKNTAIDALLYPILQSSLPTEHIYPGYCKKQVWSGRCWQMLAGEVNSSHQSKCEFADFDPHRTFVKDEHPASRDQCELEILILYPMLVG